MFPSDIDRVIPRKRGNLIAQALRAVFFLAMVAFAGYFFFASELSEIVESLTVFLSVPLIAVLVAVPLAMVIYENWDQQRKWKALAEEMGWQVQQKHRFATPTLQGTHRGHKVTITEVTNQRGRSREYYTQYVVQLNTPVKDNFQIERRNLMHMNRYKTGDEGFDRRHSTQASSTKLIEQILGVRRLRQGLIELGENARSKALVLKGNTLGYVEGGKTSDMDYLRAATGLLSELATNVERIEQMDYFS
jgi:hypothetical protein